MKKKLLIAGAVFLTGGVAVVVYSCAIEEEALPDKSVEDPPTEYIAQTRTNSPVMAPDWDVLSIHFIDGGVFFHFTTGGGAYVIDAVSVTPNRETNQTTVTYGEIPYSSIVINGLPPITGGNNGPSGSPDPGTITPPDIDDPLTRSLFEGELTEEQWEGLDDMLKKIIQRCIGGNLYNALAIKGRFDIKFDFNRLTAGFSDDGTITLRDYDAGSLFHEMFHAWQHYQETPTTRDASRANREVEAYVAEYRFAGELTSSKYRENIRSLSNDYISRKGARITPSDELATPFNELYMNTINLINNQYKGYNKGKELPFDDNRSFNQNFNNLQHLSRNC